MPNLTARILIHNVDYVVTSIHSKSRPTFIIHVPCRAACAYSAALTIERAGRSMYDPVPYPYLCYTLNQ